jgi:hypothetical protein
MLKKISILVCLLIIGFAGYFNIALAQDTPISPFQNSLQKTSLEMGYKPSNLLGNISTIISLILSLVGVIFLVLMIYGGINWMTAGGNEAQVKKAKSTIGQAVIGLVIVLSAYAITYFIMQSLAA